MTFDELKFKAEEISSDYGPLARRAHMATELNRILKEKLERAPVVFCTEDLNRLSNWENECTHKARLVCIEEIPKTE